MKLSTHVQIFGFVLLIGASSFGQFATVQYYDQNSAQTYEGHDYVANAGDVDADGINDLIVTVRKGASSFYFATHLVRVRSGKDGSILHEWQPNILLGGFGAITALGTAGDVNNDGFDDPIIGRDDDSGIVSTPGDVVVYSGLDGSVLYHLQGASNNARAGQVVIGLGDINNDGHDDLAYSEPRRVFSNASVGSIRVISGIDGSLIRSHANHAPAEIPSDSILRAGHPTSVNLDNAGDVNGDGIDDIIVGEPHYGGDMMPEEIGRVQVYSGSDGSALYTFIGLSKKDYLGAEVGGVGDIDNDGYDDFAIDDFGGTGDLGSSLRSPRVRIFSGLTGLLLLTNMDAALQFDTIAGLGDVTGDGSDDFALTEGTQSPVRCYSGADGFQIAVFRGYSSPFGAVNYVDGLGDINGDGKDDIVMTSTAPLSVDSKLRVFLSGVDPISSYQSIAGPAPALNLEWQPDLGLTHNPDGALICSGATPGASGVILISLAAADQNIFGFSLLSAVDPSNLVLIRTLGANSNGEFVMAEISRRNPFLAGTCTYVQVIETNPLIQASNGIKFLVMP